MLCDVRTIRILLMRCTSLKGGGSVDCSTLRRPSNPEQDAGDGRPEDVSGRSMHDTKVSDDTIVQWTAPGSFDLIPCAHAQGISRASMESIPRQGFAMTQT